MSHGFAIAGTSRLSSEDAGHRLRAICLALPEAAEVAMKRRPTYGEATADLVVASPAHGKAASSRGR